MIIEKIVSWMLVVALALSLVIAFPSIDAKTTSSSVTVGSKSPIVESIAFGGDTVINNDVSLLPGPDTTDVVVTAMIYCKNGPSAIDNVLLEMDPSIGAYDEIAMVENSMDPSTHTAEYVATIDVPHNTAPNEYEFRVTATHRKDGVAVGIGNENLTVLVTVAIDTSTDGIDFGVVDPGETSELQIVGVSNLGNVNITLAIEPSDLTYEDATINGESISTTWDETAAIEIDDEDDVELTIEIPIGVLDGVYTGEIEFAAARD